MSFEPFFDDENDDLLLDTAQTTEIKDSFGIKVENGEQLYLRLRKRKFDLMKESNIINNLDINLFPDNNLYMNTLIEIYGDINSGKSILLLNIIAKIILPIEFNGQNRSVIMISCTHEFNMIYFSILLEKILLNNLSLINKKFDFNIQEIIKNSLKKLNIFNCFEPNDYEFSLILINKLMSENKDDNISLIAIDPICFYYWIEVKNDKKEFLSMQKYYEDEIKKFKSLCEMHNIIGIIIRPPYLRLRTPNTDEIDKLFTYRFELKPLTDNKIKNSNFDNEAKCSSNSNGEFSKSEIFLEKRKDYKRIMIIKDYGICEIQQKVE